MKTIERRLQKLEQWAQELKDKREDEAWQPVIDGLSDAELDRFMALCIRIDAGETKRDLPESDRRFLEDLEAMAVPLEW